MARGDRPPVSPERFFANDPVAYALYTAVRKVVDTIGDAGVRVGKSQVSFRHRRPFAAVWMPAQYLSGDTAPLVLTVYLPRRDLSPRWKEVVQPTAGRFTHHLELREPQDVDGEVVEWLRQAWQAAA
jgi:hypothetical protein